MKKTVKALVIAASVAAVAGIGAVSFAKWEANSAAKGDTTGSTTSVVTTIGNITVSQPTNKLKPYDQDSSNAVLTDTDAVTFWALTVTNSASVDTGVKYYISLTEEFNGGTTGKLYFSTDYEGSGDIELSGGSQTWTELKEVYSAGNETNGHELNLSNVTSGATVYICLEADDSDAQGVDVKLTVAAVQGA